MPADKSNPTELRRTAEAVARGGSIRKASITLDIERSTARRHIAAYCALPSDQIPDGKPQSVRSSDQTPNGAPMCAQSSDAVPDGAPVCTAPDLSSFAPPPGSHLPWCDLTADEGWQCVAEDSWTARQRVIRSELIENRVRVYDPGVIYPPDWTGPRLGDPVKQGTSSRPCLRHAPRAPPLSPRDGRRCREAAVGEHHHAGPALRTYVVGADGLHWNSRLEIKGETLRLIHPSCERTPRLEQDKAVSARIGAYTLRQI